MDKRCFTCKKVKPTKDFYLNQNTSDGLERNCKKCKAEIAKVAKAKRGKELGQIFGLRFRVERIEKSLREAGLLSE